MVTERYQFVDAELSKAKFDREVSNFRSLEAAYRERGWLLLADAFPIVEVALVARQLVVPAVVTGVRLDYTNYDVEPPSVRLVNPFTRVPYKAAELPVRLDRQAPGVMPAPAVIGVQQLQVMPVQPYMQWYGPDDVPFLCLAGVYEYHRHPAHSGDSWELHRSGGAGSLVRLLDVIHRYGVVPIDNYAIQLQFTPQIQGFHSNPPA